ncbi:MAG: dipeptidase PepE [Dehalococcoidia bacterium]
MTADLLLLSNSRIFGMGYLEHAADAVRDVLDGRRTIHFVPYALADHDRYTATVREALAPFGVTVLGLHTAADPRKAVETAEVLFVGGGNSFRLLKSLQQHGLLESVRRLVVAGTLRYIGSSAGTNMACPTLRTTNDMPIVQPDSFAAFGLIPFQINPHYQDAGPTSTHMGETREERITEFLEENDVPVLGMREGSWLRRRGDTLRFEGRAGARLFRRRVAPEEIESGTDLSFLVGVSSRFDCPV